MSCEFFRPRSREWRSCHWEHDDPCVVYTTLHFRSSCGQLWALLHPPKSPITYCLFNPYFFKKLCIDLRKRETDRQRDRERDTHTHTLMNLLFHLFIQSPVASWCACNLGSSGQGSDRLSDPERAWPKFLNRVFYTFYWSSSNSRGAWPFNFATSRGHSRRCSQ